MSSITILCGLFLLGMALAYFVAPDPKVADIKPYISMLVDRLDFLRANINQKFETLLKCVC